VERDLGVRIGDGEGSHRAIGAEHDESVGLGREHDRGRLDRPRGDREQCRARRAVVEVRSPAGIDADKALVAAGRRDAADRRRVRGEHVDPGQLRRAGGRRHDLPARNGARAGPDDERAVADEKRQSGDRAVPGRRARNRLEPGRLRAIANVVADDLPAIGPDEEVVAAGVEGQRGDFALDDAVQRLPRLLAARRADERLLLDHGLDDDVARTDLCDGDGTARRVGEREPAERALSIVQR
jgi:hypothetical protein